MFYDSVKTQIRQCYECSVQLAEFAWNRMNIGNITIMIYKSILENTTRKLGMNNEVVKNTPKASKNPV